MMLRRTLVTAAVSGLLFALCAVSFPQYAPEAPPQVYDFKCEATENDPDADCIFGVAGQDYPTLHQVPTTSFQCQSLLPGIYADPDAACQVYHMCLHDGKLHSFLCPNGTVFNQEYFICDLWFNVDCARAKDFYSLNEYIYKDPEPKEAKISYV
ncbi:U-scoloptoxin(01)-Er1a [Penaeus vannamei]|uniref:U-scoloptoxin(01)-Er1a n=1 Tax=Penaeus vannamei TaxID=6689 RepID=UPI000F67A0F1|nr:uncharacterized protein LOC113810207 [Penaeus vannamei]XP_027217716.1 uncharacterized protein LOC113810207 [Penaeus vannamei]XP_027217717.1 uncharacterized protein LOC113810207 [Penaeus vannamei]